MNARFKQLVARRQRMVGAAIGSGMTAKAAELGGADFLMVLSAGLFRLAGCSSIAALMPYGNANSLVWNIAESQVMPRVGDIPVFLGVCAQDPDLNPALLFARVRAAGFVGVTNFPSVGFIDGGYRLALEETGLGYDREVAFLHQAHDFGLMTTAFTFTSREAISMVRAGVDIICLDLGFAEWRDLREEDHRDALDHAIRYVTEVVHEVKEASHNPFVVVFGGPIGTPSDVAQLCQHADIQGYVGGSSVEGFPAAPLITQTMEEFKAAVSAGNLKVRFGGMTGKSPGMQKVFQTVARVADTDAPVLILGESGTGKELAARELHRLSRRRDRNPISWNCGALTETIAMSELFGHEKGAFTGATARHIGHFEQAHGSTLFMDEVTELPLSVQASLLRVIQEREIVRVGGNENIPVDVRLVAATNKDLSELVRAGKFRLDLLYRLNTIVLRIPPLRERPEDIPLLVYELTHQLSRQYGYPVPQIPKNVMETFVRHTWPGNVRELRNAVERCIILGRGERFRCEWLEEFDSVGWATSMQPVHPVAPTIRSRRQKEKLLEVLRYHGGNKSAAARELGVTRKTLYAWLREEGRRATEAVLKVPGTPSHELDDEPSALHSGGTGFDAKLRPARS